MKKIQEGTWTAPTENILKTKAFFSKPRLLKNYETWSSMLYKVFGNDDLFDEIEDMRENLGQFGKSDMRVTVANFIEDFYNGNVPNSIAEILSPFIYGGFSEETIAVTQEAQINEEIILEAGDKIKIIKEVSLDDLVGGVHHTELDSFDADLTVVDMLIELAEQINRFYPLKREPNYMPMLYFITNNDEIIHPKTGKVFSPQIKLLKYGGKETFDNRRDSKMLAPFDYDLEEHYLEFSVEYTSRVPYDTSPEIYEIINYKVFHDSRDYEKIAKEIIFDFRKIMNL